MHAVNNFTNHNLSKDSLQEPPEAQNEHDRYCWDILFWNFIMVQGAAIFSNDQIMDWVIWAQFHSHL